MSASSFRTMGLRLSGPAALCAFNPFSLLRTPSSVMLIGGICGVSFGVPSGLMKFVALVHSAFRERGLRADKTDWNCVYEEVYFLAAEFCKKGATFFIPIVYSCSVQLPWNQDSRQFGSR